MHFSYVVIRDNFHCVFWHITILEQKAVTHGEEKRIQKLFTKYRSQRTFCSRWNYFGELHMDSVSDCNFFPSCVGQNIT